MKVDELLEFSAQAARVSQTDLTTRNRHRDVVVARELFCHYAYEHLKMRHRAIAYKLNMDRSSVYHHLKRYDADIDCRDSKLWIADIRIMTLILTTFRV